MSRPSRDLTPLPDLLHGAVLAGPVRTRKPVYVDLLPPWNAGCPAGENIQAWLASTGRASMSGRGGSWSPTTRCRPSTAGSAITRVRAAGSTKADATSTETTGSDDEP